MVYPTWNSNQHGESERGALSDCSSEMPTLAIAYDSESSDAKAAIAKIIDSPDQEAAQPSAIIKQQQRCK